MPLASESPQTQQTAGRRPTPVPPGAGAQPQAPECKKEEYIM